MRERRKSLRRNTPHRVNVLSAADGHVVGRLVDITTSGMMVVTATRMLPGRSVSLRIPLPTMVNGRTEIDVTAKSIWSRPDSNPRYHRIGLVFEDLGPEEAYIIQTTLHRLHLVG